MLLGAREIPGEASYAGVGPRAFPVLIGTGLLLAGAAFAVTVLRGATVPAAALPADRRAAAWVAAGLALAIVLVRPAGFAVAAALVFALTARGFGSRRPVVDGLLGLALGVAIDLAFARGLGVSLPRGPLGWLVP